MNFHWRYLKQGTPNTHAVPVGKLVTPDKTETQFPWTMSRKWRCCIRRWKSKCEQMSLTQSAVIGNLYAFVPRLFRSLRDEVQVWLYVWTLERGANNLHMVQLIMPLPPYHLCFSKIQNWFALLELAYPGCPGKKPLNECNVVVV